jgi:hypothetical protein
MGFRDRTADRESNAHAVGFGGEKGVEQPVDILGGDPDAAEPFTQMQPDFVRSDGCSRATVARIAKRVKVAGVSWRKTSPRVAARARPMRSRRVRIAP